MKTKIQLARESSFKGVLAAEQAKAAGRKAIDKKSVTFHTKTADDSTGKAAGSTKGGVRPPSDDELTIINGFTGSAKSADEVAVFETLSANTLADRDDDYFTRSTIQGFAKLPEPFGPVGKSYMTGHDYSGMPVGRIFSVDTKTVKLQDGEVKDYEGKDPLFLTNKIYVPNTDQYKSMLENIDFGINWAVSVGVMLDAHKCSICDNDIYWFFCLEGHVKGAYYDPNSNEVDEWGWPKEVDAGSKGAVKMLGVMEGAQDFYELSQVFLGAQYFAGLDNKSAVKGVLKSATQNKTPFVLLSKSESEELPFAHLDERIVKALQTYEVKHADDGSMEWVDGDGLVWTYSPGDSVLCLGKAAQTEEEEVNKDGEGDHPEAGGGQDVRRGSDGVEDGEPDDDGERDDDLGEDEVGQSDGEELGEDGEVDDPDDSEDTDEEGEEDDVSKAALLAAAKRVKAPTVILSAIAEAGDEKSVDAVLLTLGAHIKGQDEQIADLTPKAAMGDSYMKSLRVEALDWYTKAHMDPSSQKGVNTDTFEKVLDAVGNDEGLILSLIEEQKGLAQAKFPSSVRRSSVDADPNTAVVPEVPAGAEATTRGSKADSRVRRLHS